MSNRKPYIGNGGKPQDMNRTGFDYDNYRQISLVEYSNGDGFDLIEYDGGSKHSIADIPAECNLDKLSFDEQNRIIQTMVAMYDERQDPHTGQTQKLTTKEVLSCFVKQIVISGFRQ